MIFSVSTTHALRALAHLAANRGDEAMLGRDLAEKVRIPAPYLAKLLATLARAGILTASRGVRGGYRLAREPEQIALIEIVAPLEGKRARPECLLRRDQPCRDDAICSAHTRWSKVNVAYSRFLETTTLADIQGSAQEATGARRGKGGTRTRKVGPVRGRERARRLAAAGHPSRRFRAPAHGSVLGRTSCH